MAVPITCAWMTACGAGSDVPSQPIASVSKTQNPLVAEFSVATECSGQAMVEFGTDTSYGRSTAWYPTPGRFLQTPILVAGMKASTTYHMRAQTTCAGNMAASADQIFTTGPLPSNSSFPKLTVLRPNPSLSSSESPGIELIDMIDIAIPATTDLIQAMFTDRDANPIWFYDVGPGSYPFTIKPLPNGHIVFSITRPNIPTILREVDLAGNTIREMDSVALGQKVQAAGFDFVPNTYHHDLLPLENGHLIVLTNFVRPFTNLPGSPGTTEVIGDGLVDLDENWNPVWAWNSFDYLDVNRHLNGLPDWTHSNALVYSPSDGNLLLSMRHQSWVLKIDYNNGTGTGNVLWRLGYQGDFALTEDGVPTDDPSQWFSFQHFPSLVSQSGSQTTLAIWDNGDSRLDSGGANPCATPPLFLSCHSRATVFQIDESAKVANLHWDDLPEDFSLWGGSINQLGNGNVEFDINAPTPPPIANEASEVHEVTQTSSPLIIWELQIPLPYNAYRAYRVPSLYPGVAWQN